METVHATDDNGPPYSYERQGDSDACREALGDDEEFDDEEWQGIAP